MTSIVQHQCQINGQNRGRGCIVLVEQVKMAEHFTRFAEKKYPNLKELKKQARIQVDGRASAVQRIFAELNTPLGSMDLVR